LIFKPINLEPKPENLKNKQMSILSINNISLAFGGPPILDLISLEIHKGQRICFLGRNGAGKSTLMKVIAGETPPDSGTIVAAPGLRIAYLPQDVPDGLSGTVTDIVMTGAGVIGEKLVRWNALAHIHSETDEFHNLQHDIDMGNGWQIQTDVKRALTQVQLDGDLDFNTLSGGMRRRVMLARALVNDPEVLLLDEPTNHLDIQSITWLENFILGSKLTVVFVTHDRKLLKRLASRIIEIDRGKLYDWSCDYETFLSRKQSVLDAEEREWERFDKKLAQEEVWIRKGVKARRTRNEGRVRALERMRDDRRKRRGRSGSVSMAISETQRSGDRVLEVRDVSFSYENKSVINNLNINVLRGDKIGIMGPNGCGKSTLLKLLLGKIEPQQGSVSFGTNLIPVYFDQLREVLDPEKTVWENVAPGGGDTVFVNGIPKHVVSYLQDFLFTTERVKSPVKQLSGGEKNRLVLARMFTQPSNVLVLDEPTNDLDTDTLELLEELLSEYKGTVLAVSHDREFLNNLVTSTLVFDQDGSVKEFVGGYDDWERQRDERVAQEQKTALPVQSQKIDKPKNQGVRKLSYKEKSALENLPKKIEDLELELHELNMQLSDPVFFQKPGFVTEAKKQIAKIESELEESFRLWEELEGKG
jgi:ATP-binding cassette subfamily F protein uup